MRVRYSYSFCLILAFLLFISPFSYAQEITVADAKVTDPTNAGAAIASIPIEVPPGRNGIAPRLSINYNSNSANTWLGVGWDLEIGEIQRSTKFGVNYSANDFIYLSGGTSSELISRSSDWGSGYYSAKIEGAFSKFYFNSSTGGWEVTTKDGTKYYYGSTSTSRQDNQYGVFKWYLDKVQDANGNYMTISYFKDNGEVYISQIDYTRNTDGTPPTNTVKFYLEARPDVVPMYTTDLAVRTAYRLKSIDVLANGRRARAYKLTYTASDTTGISLLWKVQQYGNDAELDSTGTIISGSALPPITFEVSSERTSFESVGSVAYGEGNAAGYFFADINGDSKADMIYVKDSSNTVNTALSNGTTFVSTGSVPYGEGDPEGYRFVDLNGDGKADMVYIKYRSGDTNIVYTALSNGTTFVPSGSMGYGNGGVAGYKFADINGDGKADMIFIHKLDKVVYTALSNGSSFVHQRSMGYGEGDAAGYFFADVNGDSRADMIYVKDSNNVVYTALSDGSGFVHQGGIAYGEGNAAGYRFVDINADGKADMVYIKSDRTVYTALSNGTSFDSSGSVVYGEGNAAGYTMADINGDGRADMIYIKDSTNTVYLALSNGTSFESYSSMVYGEGNAAGYRFIDISGDGKNDMIYIKSDRTVYTSKASGGASNRLINITNSLGGTTKISYKSSSAYTNYMLPFVIQTVESIEVNDKNGNIAKTSYDYSGGLYDQPNREFRGFEYVTATLHATAPGKSAVTETRYFQDDNKKGLPSHQMVMDLPDNINTPKNIYTATINTYDPLPHPSGAVFPRLRYKTDYLCDGAINESQLSSNWSNLVGPCKEIGAEFEYDAYGNLTRKLSSGDTAVSNDGKDENTEYETRADLIAKWIVSKPKTTYIKDSTGAIKAQTWFTYDGNGNLLTKEMWNDRGPTNPAIAYTYYPNGNLESTWDANGNPPTWIEYDGDTLTYPAIITNPSGHQVIKTYDYRYGKPSTETDANYNTTNYDYDYFGRLLESNNPHDGAVAQAEKETYYDGLGRVIKARSPAEPLNGQSRYIVTETYYNDRGLVGGVSNPYYTNEAGYPIDDVGQVLPWSSRKWTTYTYDDPLGRLTDINYPDDTYASKIYNKGRTTLIDAEGHVKIEERDVYGQLIKVEEYTGVYKSSTNYHTLYATTTYRYDVLGNLVEVVDAKNNHTVITYDSLSRKIAMNDPDMGYWTYVYDENGNLLLQTDANNQMILFYYDELNRITQKDYPDGIDVDYEYDDPNMSNATGRLTRVTDESGVEEFSYDVLGRATKVTKKIGVDQYTTETMYDPLGRVASIKYPDNEIITYNYYPDSGFLQTVPGYVTYSDYNASGQPGLITYGNNVSTEKDYDPDNKRLALIRTTSQTQGIIQNLAYQYYPAGSVHIITDNKDTTRTQTFTYDELYRLKTAQSAAYSGDISFRYNEIGNMTYNSKVSANDYVYDPNHPHAVKQAGANSYGYDSNGNMINRGGVTITYDYDNMPKSMGALSFVYDHSGRRVKKIGASTTIYISDLYECTGSACTKYIFAGSTRIASVSAGVKNYYHGDHLGSSNVVTSQNGDAVEEIYYYPFGGTRLSMNNANVHYKFTDQEEDAETGLYYYGARYYDPRIGRFISADTVVPGYADPQSLNRYSYTKNNPLIYVDPDGNSWAPSMELTYDYSSERFRYDYTGYQWRPEAMSYNGDGTLKAGLYHQAIFFTDNGTFNPNSNYNIGSSTAYVYKADGTIVTFDAATYPSYSQKYPTVPEGIYDARVGLHDNKYTALRMDDVGRGERVVVGSERIELGKRNPAYSDGRTFISGANIHKAGRETNKTMIDSKGNIISEGCLLIDSNRWDEFINIFDNNKQRTHAVSVTVSRTYSAPRMYDTALGVMLQRQYAPLSPKPSKR